MPEVLILTGPPGAGKSSVAEALAERYDRVAHVSLDALHEFITPTGHVHPWGKPELWAHQQALLDRCAAGLAREFILDRFAVIIDGVVCEAAHLQRLIELLQPTGASVHYVRLLPSLETCIARNGARDVEQRMQPKRIEAVYRQFEAAGDIGGSTIDSISMSVYETADRLQSLTTSGASLVLQPEQATA